MKHTNSAGAHVISSAIFNKSQSQCAYLLVNQKREGWEEKKKKDSVGDLLSMTLPITAKKRQCGHQSSSSSDHHHQGYSWLTFLVLIIACCNEKQRLDNLAYASICFTAKFRVTPWSGKETKMLAVTTVEMMWCSPPMSLECSWLPLKAV